MKKSRSIITAVVAVLLTFALAVPGVHAQSSQEGYIQPGPEVIDQTDNDQTDNEDRQQDGSAEPSSAEELPFTGLDLGLLAAAGASLLLLGAGMRRLTRGPNSSA